MGANEKVAATFHPGRSPVMPPIGLPEKSGVTALLGAADRTLAHHQNMQTAIDDIRAIHVLDSTLCINCSERWPCSTIAALEQHHV